MGGVARGVRVLKREPLRPSCRRGVLYVFTGDLVPAFPNLSGRRAAVATHGIGLIVGV